MGLFNRSFIQVLRKIIDKSEEFTADEFKRRIINTENEYTYSLLLQIRNKINSHNLLGLFANSTILTQTLPPKLERDYGADACIILVDHDQRISKVCLFEAKLPRHGSPWDQIPKNKQGNNKSHFSSQLSRQHPISQTYAIWEQFYCYGYNQANSLNNIRTQKNCKLTAAYKSLCLLHEDAYIHDRTKNGSVWNISDIEKTVPSYSNNTNFKPITMSGMVKHACDCKIGTPLILNKILSIFSDFIHIPPILFIEASTEKIDTRFSDIFKRENPTFIFGLDGDDKKTSN